MPCPARITGRCDSLMSAAASASFARAGEEIRNLPVRPRRGRLPIELARTELRILGDVHQHRSGPVRRRDVKGLAQAGRHFVGPRHQVIVFGNRQRDAGDVHFLKSVAAQHRAAHLPGDAHDGRRIHHRRGDPRDHVGRAGSRGRQRHAHPPAGPRVAVGHMRGALFMPHQHVMHPRFGQGVIGRKNGASGIPEDVLDAQPLQAFPDNLGAGQLSRRGSPAGGQWIFLVLTASLKLASLACLALIHSRNSHCESNLCFWRIL